VDNNIDILSSSWKFFGSEDGEVWTLLHTSQNDAHLHPTREQRSSMREWLGRFGGDDNSDAKLAMMERDFRHTWEIDATAVTGFYKYFRFIGGGTEDGLVEEESTGAGFELYGEIQE
jgi:hypothetical protein